MAEELLVLLVVGSIAWALLELWQVPNAAVRSLPRWAWPFVIVLLAPFGPMLWFVAGRPRATATTPAGPRSAPGNPLHPLHPRRTGVARPAPDDDPEFLALLNARADQQRRLRRLEEDLRSPDGPDSDPERPN
jgi:hypothetical protein